MEKETCKVLEYDRIKEMLVERACSSLGKEKARKLFPSSDFEEVQEHIAETAEAGRVAGFSAPPFGGICDLRPLLNKVKLGAALDLSELVNVRSTLYAIHNLKKFFKELEVESPILKTRAREIEILGQLERNLENAIDEHGTLRDDASAELYRIRKKIRFTETHIKERMGKILHAADNQKYFQDAIVTIRNERYVIPVKAEYRRFFPGLVHDQSSTGATLFIEPMEIVELNNDVKQLMLAEHQEVQRILRLLSQQVQKEQDILLANSDILAFFDFTFAKAHLAEDMQAVEPRLNNSCHTHLKQARHPLIPAESVVPIDIELGGDHTMLLITGPNTGGKTVAMKTLGLLVLMAQSGCFLPTAPDSEIAVYENVYADIGDEQSIEQSLSTFSAHMKHIVYLLKKVENKDLVLLDELGAGTDPEEGAALAMAILEQLLSLNVSVIVTTHYSELKTFAYQHKGIENACVEFDIKTLRPTYRLLMGIPGASNAFAVSQRLGLPNSIILRARQLVKADHAQFEHVVDALENEKMMYEQRNADILERQLRVKKLEAKVEATKNELSRKKAEMIKKAREQSAAMVRRTRRETEEIIDSLKKQYDDMGIHARQKAIQDARRRLEDVAGRTRPGIVAQKGIGKKIVIKDLHPGDLVYVSKLDQKGTLISIHGNELVVQMGSLRTEVKASACRFIQHGGSSEKSALERGYRGNQRNANGSAGLLAKAAQVQRDIDIRGLMVNEAESILAKFLDDALVAGLSNVLIIHGKGTGALRKGVHQFLKRNKNVDSFHFADIDEGGTGATLVHLKA